MRKLTKGLRISAPDGGRGGKAICWDSNEAVLDAYCGVWNEKAIAAMHARFGIPIAAIRQYIAAAPARRAWRRRSGKVIALGSPATTPAQRVANAQALRREIERADKERLARSWGRHED